MNEKSSETYSIWAKKPVISRDITQDPRFIPPDFMRDAGVVALVNVPILLPGGRAYGLLQVDASEPRDFDRNDSEFLRTYATILGPVIDRLFKLSDLRRSEERFRLTVEEASDYAIFLTDGNDRITDWLPGAAAVYGWNAADAIGQSASVLFTREDREAGEDRKEIETARRDGVAPNVRWHLREDGRRVFIDGSVRALRDENGSVTGFIKIGQDATERKDWQERLEVLVAELQHRTRNLLTVVRSISEKTATDANTLEEYVTHFRERLSALSRINGLLSRLQKGERVTFDVMLRTEIDALGLSRGRQSERITLDGPLDIGLRSSTVQTFAIAIHELATNAVKYGALAGDQGMLTVRWYVSGSEGAEHLHVEWVESGIADMPQTQDQPQGGGYGRQLIERALPYQLHAKTTYELTPDGVRCTISLPLSG